MEFAMVTPMVFHLDFYGIIPYSLYQLELHSCDCMQKLLRDCVLEDDNETAV
jgi:hypothetical protein